MIVYYVRTRAGTWLTVKPGPLRQRADLLRHAPAQIRGSHKGDDITTPGRGPNPRLAALVSSKDF